MGQSRAIWKIKGGLQGGPGLASCLRSERQPDDRWAVLGHEDPVHLPIPAILSAHSFRNFDVEESHQCSLDWLLLGPAAPPRQEAFRLCGSAIPPAFISARDHVWIFFHSDASSSGQAQGFRLSYIRGDASKLLHWPWSFSRAPLTSPANPRLGLGLMSGGASESS